MYTTDKWMDRIDKIGQVREASDAGNVLILYGGCKNCDQLELQYLSSVL